MKKLSIGVVGCGYWGPNLARNFNANPTCNLKTVCDLNQDRLDHMSQLYPGIKTETEFERLIEDPELDALVIAVPVKHHYSLAKACLEAGKHALIEKPMASSSKECEDLIRIAKENRLTLMVGHTFLYSEPVRQVAKIIGSGDIGELQYINCQRLNLGIFQKDINVAWDLAPHDISIILHIIGDVPLTVNCQGNDHVTPGIEDVTNMSLNFKDKKFATVQSSWIEPRKVRQMTFVGTRQMIVYNDINQIEAIRIYDVRVEKPPHYDSFADFHCSYHYGDTYIPHLKLEEPLKRLTQHFLDCIETGETPLTSGEQGLEVVRILELSSESLEASGGAIPFEPKKPIAMPRNKKKKATSKKEVIGA